MKHPHRRTPRPLVSALTGAALLTGISVAPARAQGGAPVRIRLGMAMPQGTSYHHLLVAMGERWRADTKGQVQLTVYAGTMGSEAELVRRMRLGQLQAAALTAVGLRVIDPGVGALQLMPLVYRSQQELDFVRGRMEPLLGQRLAERGFVALFWATAGWAHHFLRRPVTRPGDFRPLKYLVTAGDNTTYDIMKSAGFSPVPLEWSDGLTALQTGMIDVVETIPYHALAMQYYVVDRYMLDLNWAPVVGAAIVSKKVWDQLTPEAQAALREAAAETGRQFEERARIENAEAVAAMARRGLSVVPVPTPARAEWQAVADGFYPRIRGSLVPADMFDEVMRLLAEYRRSGPGQS